MQIFASGSVTRGGIGKEIRSSSLRRTSIARRAFRGSSEHVRLVERYTRVGPDTMHYEFMVDDETRFAKSWTAMIPLQKIEGPIFEYACHEGNYGLVGILAGARADDAAAQAGGR